MTNDVIAALEIGTSMIRSVVCEIRDDDSISVLALSEVKSNGIRKGEIFDRNEVIDETGNRFLTIFVQPVRAATADAGPVSMEQRGSVHTQETDSHIKAACRRTYACAWHGTPSRCHAGFDVTPKCEGQHHSEWHC